jgi:hypothetical protein
MLIEYPKQESQMAEHQIRLDDGVGFRQLRRCRRTRPGVPSADSCSAAKDDHLVGASEHYRRHGEPERLRS